MSASQRLKSRVMFAAVAGTVLCPAYLRAADGTWSSTVGGTWGDSINWLNSQLPNTVNDNALFATNGNSQAITVRVQTTIKSLQFGSIASGAITLSPASGAGTLSISPANSGDLGILIDSASGDHIFNTPVRLQGVDNQLWQINSSRTLTLNGTLTGNTATRGFTKTGSGTLILNGSLVSGSTLTSAVNVTAGTLVFGGANSFAGGLNLTGGTTVFNFAGNNSDKTTTAATLTLGGGVLSLIGNSSAATNAAIGDATLVSGVSQIRTSPGAGPSATLTLNRLTRNSAGGVLDLSIAASSKLAIANTSAGTVNGYLTVAQNDWAKPFAGGSQVVQAFSLYDVNNDPSTWGIAQNITDSTGFSGTVGSLQINTLRFNASANSTVDIASGNVLTLLSSGLMVTSNVGNKTSTIQGGTLLAGNGLDLIIHQHNTAGSLVISSVLTSPAGLTKVGAGVVVLQGANNYSGPNYIHAGTVRAESSTALGSGITNLNAATLDLAASISGATINLGDGATIKASGLSTLTQNGSTQPIVASGAAVTFSAPTGSDVFTLNDPLRGGSGATVNVVGSGTVALRGGATISSAFSGVWVVNMGNSGILRLSDSNALGNNSTTPGSARVVGGTVVTAVSTPIANSITLAGGALGVTTNTTGTFSGGITLAASTTSNLSLTDPGNGTSARNLQMLGPIGGSGNITIGGAGVATFAGSSNYTGETTINSGKLTLAPSNAALNNNIASSSKITIAGGATLDVSNISASGGFKLGTGQTLAGKGTVAGAFTADAANSTVAPADTGAAGSLTFNSDFTLATGSKLQVELGGTNAGVDYDQVVIGSGATTVSIGGAALQVLHINGFTPHPTQTTNYTIVKNNSSAHFSDTFSNLAENATIILPGGTYSIHYNAGDGNDIILTSVPEPTSVAISLLGGALLMRRRRK